MFPVGLPSFRSLGALLGGIALVTGFAVSASAATLPGKTINAGVLTTSPPFAYQSGSSYKGMTYDILSAIAKMDGFKIDASPMGFDAMIPAMQARQIDVAVAGFYVTPAREKIVDFSVPFFSEGSVLAVPMGSDVKSFADLKGKTIVSQQGSAALTIAEKLASQYGFKVTPIAEEATMMLAVKSGNAAGVFYDSAIVQYRIAQGGNQAGIRTVGQVYDPTDIAFALPKNSPWTPVLSEGIEKLKASGELAKIESQYVAK